MVARIGAPVDAAEVRGFNERHNSAAQRAWFADHVQAWAATQHADLQALAAEMVNECRWLVRGSNAGLAMPLTPKSTALKEPCNEAPRAVDDENDVPTREEFLGKTISTWRGEELAPPPLEVRAQVYAAVYELPAVASEKIATEAGNDGGTGAVLLLESVNLSGSPLTQLPGGLDVGGSLLARQCKTLVALPQRIGWDLDAAQCSGLHSVALVNVGGDVSLEHCDRLSSMAECDFSEVRGMLNLEKCTCLQHLPRRLREVRGDLSLAGIKELPSDVHVHGDFEWVGDAARLPSGLRVDGYLSLEGHTTLTELPTDISVGGNVFLEDLVSLKRLPPSMRVVNGCAQFTGLRDLEELPDGFEVRARDGDGSESGLSLERCVSLASLPVGLKVDTLCADYCTGLERLPAGLVLQGHCTFRGCTSLRALPSDLVVGGDLVLDFCCALEHMPAGLVLGANLSMHQCTGLRFLPPGLVVPGWLIVADCTSLLRLPDDMVVKSGLINHRGCTRLQWRKLLDWRDPEDQGRSLDVVLHVILGFLEHDEVRVHCSLVNRHWAAVAAEVAPAALKGCRGDWVTRVVTELQQRGDDAHDGFHVVPTAQWLASSHVRVEKMWVHSEDRAKVLAEAVVKVQAPWLAPPHRQPVDHHHQLEVSDTVNITAADFGIVSGHVLESCATVTAIDADTVRLEAVFTFDEQSYMEFWEHCTMVSPQHSAAWKEAQNAPVQEGVCHADDDVPAALQERLQIGIDMLAASQPADYHPNSDNIVRHRVHPALYPFVHGTSPFVASADLPTLPARPGTESAVQEHKDMWGRPYKSSTYQRLPTYLDVAAGSGRVTIRDDINNLRPRVQHVRLYDALADLFGQFLPEIDIAQAYAEQVDLNTAEWGEKGHFVNMDRPYLPLPMGARLAASWQVITKVVDYELQPGQTYEGMWHVEGMSHEHILCTCLYVLDQGDIVGGDLLFKRGLNFIEGKIARDNTGESTDSVTRRMLDSEDAMVPLGKLATPTGRRIVFPNSHVHKLTELKNVSQAPQRRRIVAFFVVDPKHRTVSTQECPDQSAAP